MRSLQSLGVVCITAMSGAAFAESGIGPSPHPQTEAAYLVVDSGSSGAWRERGAVPRQDRLNYLNGAICLERRGCSSALARVAAPARVAERDYIDALNLGSYGPMNLKFTGDRVKLKVHF